jgi:ABC-type lipoprotein export system ATPase subunit
MILEIKDIKKQYALSASQNPLVVLDKVSLAVEERDSLAITGPSGSGKTTLLNLMGTLDKPDSGSIKILGRDLSGLSDEALSKIRNQEIGFIFQLHHLLPQCTALENVLLPGIPFREDKGDQLKTRALNLMERVGLENRWDSYPGQLSVGEMQRVAVARALINKPKLILADEPTGSLDKKTSDALLQLLINLNQEEGSTLIIVTHSMELARNMGKQYLLENGVLSLKSSKIT